MIFGEGSVRMEAIGALLRTLEELQALGSADALAAFLTEQNATGELKSAAACPLHTYVSRALSWHRGDIDGRVTSLSMGQASIQIHFAAEPGRLGERLVLTTPPALRAFACAFDDGAYPALIAAPVEA